MLLQVHQQTPEVEQASPGLQFDQEIDVARGIRVARTTEPKTWTLRAPYRAAIARIAAR
jgi:hypothetical protein